MKIVVLAVYVIVLAAMGYISRRRSGTLEDFFLGNRGIGPWMSAFAYGTTYFSAVIFIGYAGRIGWGFGVSGLWIALGNALVGSYLAWRVLAGRTREITSRLGTRTMPEFLEARYDSRGLKLLSALAIFIFLVPYSASVYMGLSYLFEGVFGIPYVYAVTLMTILTAGYLVVGGYFAVNLTDAFQGSIMILGVVLMVWKVLAQPQVGGLAVGLSRLASINPKLAGPVGPPGFFPLLFLVLLTSLGPWGLPQMVQKFYAIKDEKSISRAMVVSTLFALVIAGAAYFVGSLSHLFFAQLPADKVGPNADLLIPQMITMAMPGLVSAFILVLVLSASMSTLSSLVLVSSSAIAIDLLGESPASTQGQRQPQDLLGGARAGRGRSKQKGRGKQQAPAREAQARASARDRGGRMRGGSQWGGSQQKDQLRSLWLMKGLCVLFIVLSALIAFTKPAFILSLMALSWGTLAGMFLAPYLYGLYWRGVTRAGAWAGLVAGLAISVGLAWYFKMDAGKIPMTGSLAMLIPLLVVPAVSMVTRKYPEAHLSRIFERERELGLGRAVEPAALAATKE